VVKQSFFGLPGQYSRRVTKANRRARRLYNTFSIDIVGQSACLLPLPPSNLAIFFAYLYQHNYASSIVNTNVSVFGYIHRLAGVADPTRVFLLWKC